MTVESSIVTEAVTPDELTGAVDGVHSHNEEHVAEAISHLIEFFRNGPRNQALLTAIMDQVQEVEDANWAHKNAFDVDTAVGDQLDLLGKRVGERRDDRTDAAYRTAVRTRILVNRSNGRLEELIAIAIGISPGATVYVQELYPSTISMELDTFGSATLQQAYRLLKKAKTAGVRLLLVGGGTSESIGAVDGTPVGGTIGAVDGTPAGFVIAGGT